MATPYYLKTGDDGGTLSPSYSIDVSSVGANSITKGQQQPRTCQDSIWAILFYGHLGLIIGMAIMFAPQMATDVAESFSNRRLDDTGGGDDAVVEGGDDGDAGGGEDYYEEAANLSLVSIVSTVGVAGLAGFVISSLAMVMMMHYSEGLIKLALFFNIILALYLGVVALILKVIPVAIVAGVGCLFSVYYAYVCWSRIPFAAANLVTGITAVKANLGLTFFAYAHILLTFGWTILWAIATVSTLYVVGDCDPQGTCEKNTNGWLVFFLLLSYFWTSQIIKNVVHTTVAGTVGTWWYFPYDAGSCCSSGVRSSYMRSITTSFGSICLGSLIVAIIQSVQEIVRSVRDKEDSMFMCVAECLIGCLESLVEYFSSWAYVYVGLYGYSFMKASSHVMELFRMRGWTSIVADTLVDTVLFMASCAVGLLTGIVAVIAAVITGIPTSSIAILAGVFLVGMAFGFVIGIVLFCLISSAVQTVIVCFAESPAEFEVNYPDLSQAMNAAWREAYPNEFKY